MTRDLPDLGWAGILRLGLVQTMLGALAVLVTVTMNRVMVVELRLPPILPASLVALQYGVQVMRPAMGHGSDRGGRRVPWIRGGVLLAGIGAMLAAQAIALVGAGERPAGIGLAVLAYAAIGIGIGTAGTSLLALLAQRVAPERRPSAAATTWIMMIAGIALCAGLAGHALLPFSLHRLEEVTAFVAALALLLTLLATAGIERVGMAVTPSPHAALLPALRAVWQDPAARRFTLFVALSMLAYNAEEILLEPFAATVFGLSPGLTARLTGLQHGGVLCGMLLVALCAGRAWSPPLRLSVLTGCLLSAASLLVLACSGLLGLPWLLRASVLTLGLGNGVFAVAAIGSMMQMAGRRSGGLRIGVWGAAQALAFAAGDLGGAGAIQAVRAVLTQPSESYALVLALEAALFLLAAVQSVRVFGEMPGRRATAGRALTMNDGVNGAVR